MASFKTYISIDVATKSLAIGVYKLRAFTNIINNIKSTNIIDINTYCDETIQCISMNVYDINNGLKSNQTNYIQKSKSLKETLHAFDLSIDLSHETVEVLIEYQMNANHMSNAIFNMILFHYCDKYPIHVIKPSLKNTLSLHPCLCLSNVLATSSSNYLANKKHTTYNMLFLLTLMDKLYMINGIHKKNYDDIADTLCQAIAWHKLQYV